MSTTMQQGLSSLLIRRTEAGRARALRCIQAWQHAISAVRKAESMAECRIKLPDEQVQGVHSALGEAGTANYVLAVHLANQATTKREAVQATAIKVLQEEMKHCGNKQSDATHTILKAIREQDSAVAAAENARKDAVYSIYAQTTGSIEEDPTGLISLFAYLLVLATLIAFIVYGDFLVHGFFTRVVSGLVAFTVSALWIVNTIVNMVKQLRYVVSEERYRSRTAVAESTFCIEVDIAEKRLQEQKVILEKRISQAETHKTKVEETLQWLQAELMRHD
jgi:hypothetical protein